MKQITLYSLVTLIWCCCLCSADAALVIAVGNADNQSNPILVTPGQTGASIRFEVRAVGESFSMTGYNFAIEFGGDDFGIPENAGVPLFSNFTVAPVLGGFNTNSANLNLDATLPTDNNAIAVDNGVGPINYDFVVNDDRGLVPSLLLDGQASALFDLTFDVAPGAGNGIYDVQFVLMPSYPDDLGFDNNFATDPEDRPVSALNGSIQVNDASAVPEPGSVLALAGLCVAGGVRQWRKKKRASVPA